MSRNARITVLLVALVVIVAGYPSKMREFIQANPGLESRFPRHFLFADYSPEEMQAIFETQAARASYSLTAEAAAKLQRTLVAAGRGLRQKNASRRHPGSCNCPRVRSCFGCLARHWHHGGVRLRSPIPGQGGSAGGYGRADPGHCSLG